MSSEHELNLKEAEALFQRICNWGRWGADDQRGALNLITAAKRAAAARLAQSGELVSLAHPLWKDADVENVFPLQHMMLAGLADSALDYFGVACHGVSFTHLDALCHHLFRGKMYNGFSQSEIGRMGTNRCGLELTAGGIVSRGVLLDIPKLKHVEWLEPAQPIYPADLDAALKLHGVELEAGDIVFVRTGRHRRRQAQGQWDGRARLAGLAMGCLQWIRDHDIAVLGSDGVSDVRPVPFDGALGSPIHNGTLTMMGVYLIDNCNLEAIAEACQRNARYVFQCTVAPLIIERATGCPVNPLAMF